MRRAIATKYGEEWEGWSLKLVKDMGVVSVEVLGRDGTMFFNLCFEAGMAPSKVLA